VITCPGSRRRWRLSPRPSSTLSVSPIIPAFPQIITVDSSGLKPQSGLCLEAAVLDRLRDPAREGEFRGFATHERDEPELPRVTLEQLVDQLR